MRYRAILFSSLLLLAGCQETPTGRNQLVLVPESQMAEMGRQAFEEIKRNQTRETDPAVNQAVQCIAKAVINVVSDQQQAWEVVVFRDPQPNAFALPGGKIGVNTGLMRVAKTPAQLAAVIGHEIGHVLAEHGNERVTQELGISAVLYLVNFFGEGDSNNQQLIELLGVGAQLGITLPFSREHEREADILGLELMAKAGFDPRQSVELWKNMAQATGNQPFEFLSTHPSHDSRSETLQKGMAKALQLYETVEKKNEQRCSF